MFGIERQNMESIFPTPNSETYAVKKALDQKHQIVHFFFRGLRGKVQKKSLFSGKCCFSRCVFGLKSQLFDPKKLGFNPKNM